jgi:hypothetical protein
MARSSAQRTLRASFADLGAGCSPQPAARTSSAQSASSATSALRTIFVLSCPLAAPGAAAVSMIAAT